MPGFAQRNCVFDCSKYAQDSLEHYCWCHTLIKAVRGIHAANLTNMELGGIEIFFGVGKGLSSEDIILNARLMYVRMRLIHRARLQVSQGPLDWSFLAAVEFNKSL